jgi:hypothetical protein
LISIKPMGSVNEAMKRVQNMHRDTNQTIYDEAGEVHSVFCVQFARILRVTCLDTGEDRLIVLEGGVVHALHGRWRHSGWCLPETRGRSNFCSTNICLFLYVAKSANESMTRSSISRSVSWKDNKMNYTDAYYVCNQSTGELDSKLPECSLEWQHTSVHEACSSCAAISPIYNLPG